MSAPNGYVCVCVMHLRGTSPCMHDNTYAAGMYSCTCAYVHACRHASIHYLPIDLHRSYWCLYTCACINHRVWINTFSRTQAKAEKLLQALGNERNNRIQKEKMFVELLQEERSARLQAEVCVCVSVCVCVCVCVCVIIIGSARAHTHMPWRDGEIRAGAWAGISSPTPCPHTGDDEVARGQVRDARVCHGRGAQAALHEENRTTSGFAQ